MNPHNLRPQASADGYLAYYNLTDRAFFGLVEDRTVWDRWGAAVEGRVRRLAALDGDCPPGGPD